jgi:cytidylate kinase
MTTSATKTIAISRQRGSGGSRVARSVADRLGFRYIDRELLRLAAEYLRTSTENAATPPSSWWSRLSEAFASGGADGGYTPSLSDAVYEGELFDIEQRLLAEIVAEQAAVIVGRGAAQSLRGRPDVVSVFLHAPDTYRLARVQQLYNLRDEKAARRAIESSDADRARFIRSLTEADWTDARSYDLTVDTASVGLERTADLIVQLAR